MISARVLADSIYRPTPTVKTSSRLTTFEVIFPRSILAEFNTHKMISKNFASSRAIPNHKLIQRVEDNPFIPSWKLNQKGMSPGEPLSLSAAKEAYNVWIRCRDTMVSAAKYLGEDLDIHKGYVNRLLEPWMYVTGICTATDYDNLFFQRYDAAAEPSFYALAKVMYEQFRTSEPKELKLGQWHRPLANDEETVDLVCGYCADKMGLDLTVIDVLNQVSAGRCARVSVFNHEGIRSIDDDLKLYSKMVNSVPGHWSPLEHVATPAQPEDMVYRLDQLETINDGTFIVSVKPDELGYCGNLKGFKQLRKFFPNENVTEFYKEVTA